MRAFRKAAFSLSGIFSVIGRRLDVGAHGPRRRRNGSFEIR
ncbi:hypothetical protein BN940_12151 [Castellaniella defragrans 65Phen]|uniref:Uncharacterized protein n=2 Tax=Castellaniella defragrans TaxID=75697 RepID=W8X552_CASD6|nr:hypothetical protein [Castellaniella defragrans]CDM24886.1 hypothetical protein BN940_12151 [Castellaniella defragrans 65Phen]